ncbi:MAG: M12 family metallo-peptidase [Phycisphaerales bacterium]
MKTPKALSSVLACSAVMLWTGDLTGQVRNGVRGPAVPVIPELLQYDLQTLDLPATEQQPFTAEVRLGDQMQTLVLDPYTMRADDFRVLVQGEDGQLREVEPPPPRTYRGTVQGEPLSRVSATLMDGQLWAVIAEESGHVWYIEPLSELAVGGAPNTSHVIYQGEDLVPVDGVCGTDDIFQPLANLGDRLLGGDVTAGTGLQTTDIAFDADWEFYLLNGSSVPATVADIENVMGNVEFVYERDTDITYEITTFVVRTANNDPYTSTDAETLLNQFRNAWNSVPERDIRRDIAQLFTGKNLNGTTIGIAWVGTICHNVVNGLGYSVVQSRYTNNSDLRAALSAHELGHSWNAGHCGGNTCHIMCTGLGGCGGVFGANLKFGPVSINAIVAFRNTRVCLFEQPPTLVPPFFDDFDDNVLIDTDKWSYSFGAFVTVAGVNEPSEPRSLTLDGNFGIYQKDEVRTNFIDMVGQNGSILSYFTEHIGVEAGESLIVEYWALNRTWKILNVINSDGVNQTEYDFFTHDLPTDAMHGEFRVRFRTTVNLSNDDWYVDDVFIGMPASCPWDLDDNGTVGASDLLSLLAQWGMDPGGPPDFDGDGNVGASDLLALLANWGPCP